MGKIAYVLRLFAGLMMIVAALATFESFSDAMVNLGRPEGERTLGALFLIATASFLAAFLAAGMLWVLSEISEQLDPLGKFVVAPPIVTPSGSVRAA
jgi:hypothetical protein